MKLPNGWRRRLHLLTRRKEVERELDEELAFHLELEAAKNIERGMSPEEARRRAALAFGGASGHREAVRDERWLGRLHGLSPDFKLALRMLRKNPALAIVGGLGMAVGMAIAAAVFTFMAAFYYSSPPLADGDRIVAITNLNLLNNDQDRSTAFDYLTWRESLRSIEDVAATIMIAGVHLEGDESRPLPDPTIARMTASGFELSRVPPLFGRPILPADEEPGAPPVVVLGYDEWMDRFGGDRAVVGEQLRIGGVEHTIVGVMPEGFRFPSNHGYWLPLTIDPAMAQPGPGPQLLIFGRLAPGATRQSAEAELATIGQRLAADYPEMYERHRAIVRPYVHAILDLMQYPAWSIWLMQLLAGLILAAVAINVAVLVYARTAARAAELTVRTALGARRRRIVAQLFLEALVLSGCAAAVGLLIAQLGYRQLRRLPDTGFIPYWISDDLPLSALAYGAALACFAAFIVGVLPALQATGRSLQGSLRELGGGTGMRMGRTWTLLIVVQVAIAVAVLPAVVAIAYNEFFGSRSVPTFPVDELLSVRVTAAPLATGGDDESRQRELAATRLELARRLELEPGVAGVALASAPPGIGLTTRVLVDGPAATDPPGTIVSAVDPAYFDVMGVPLLAGRSFQTADQLDGSAAVIVNRAFVGRILGDGQGLGRRFRLPGLAPGDDVADGPAYEIVGIVEDMFAQEGRPEATTPAVFRPLRPEVPAGMIAVRAQATPADLTPRVRTIAMEVAPSTTVAITSMALAYGGARQAEFLSFLLPIIALITLSLLLLSAAGISALMSFAVTRRQREIGIRTALGAPRQRIVASIFSRASRQIGGGLMVGTVLAGGLDWLSGAEYIGGSAAVVLPMVAAMMVMAGLVASVGPARRALGIQPMEALRQE